MGIKYQLETIPVWDGITSNSECFLCDLMQEAQKDSLKFYLGSSVMNPETRIKVNEIGFCPNHTTMLVQSGSPNAMAVLWESHFAQTRRILENSLSELSNTHNPKKTITKLSKTLKTRIENPQSNCLICKRMKDRLTRYCFTIAYLWGQEQNFKTSFANSKGFCLPHMTKILELSLEALDSKQQKEFAKAMSELQSKNLERVAHDLWYMTEHYKSENVNKPWNGCEDAQKRAVYKEIGNRL